MSRRPRPIQSRFLSLLWNAGSRLLPPRLNARLAPHPRHIRATRPTVSVAFLPPAWEGVRIALLSDLHVGRFIRAPYVRCVVEMTNDLAPDLVALLGDYASKDGAISADVVESLSLLRAPLGLFAVLGNHDHWHDARETTAALGRAGIQVLCNAHRRLVRGGQGLCLAGVDDMWESTADAASALAGASPQEPRILLCHNPDYAERLPAEPRVDLMLCGHTHGGQIRLPLLTYLLASVHHRKYQRGLTQGPRCPVYVTRGLGVVGPPVRFRCPPELTILTLTPDSRQRP